MTTTRRWTRIAALTTAGLLSAALAVGGTAAASASTTSPPALSDSCSPAQHLKAVFTALPSDLRRDLVDLRSLPRDERRAAAVVIRRDARAGEYGDQVQTRAKQLAKLRVIIRKDLPSELRSDLADVRAMPPGADRRAAAAQIAAGALAGDYGAAVQDAAEKLQDSDLWQSCTS